MPVRNTNVELDLKSIFLVPINLLVRPYVLASSIHLSFGGAMVVDAVVVAAVYLLFLASTVVGKLGDFQFQYQDIGARPAAFVIAAYVGKEGRRFILKLGWSLIALTIAFLTALLCPPAYFIYTYPFLLLYSAWPLLFKLPSFATFPADHSHNFQSSSSSSSSYAYNLRWNLLLLAIQPLKPLVGTLFLSTTVDDIIMNLVSCLFWFLLLLFCSFISVKLHVTDHDDPDDGILFLLRFCYDDAMLLLVASLSLFFFFIPTNYSTLIATHFIIAPCLSFWPNPSCNFLHRNLTRLSASITTFLTFTFGFGSSPTIASSAPFSAPLLSHQENPPTH